MSFLSRVYKMNVRNLSMCFPLYKRDPGINLRKKALNINEELDDDMDFDDWETDFSNVHNTHREHVAAIEAELENEKFLIVKQKYFKQNNLNFLTWHDKEQIKYLHDSDPEEWTIEKLSEGFPALPAVVKKIVKSKWTLNSARVTNHDRSVEKNWEDFKNGKILNLPKELVDHLNKFTNRSLNFKPFEPPQTKVVINANLKPVNTEFSQIITSYNELIAKKHNTSNEDSTINIHVETLNDMSAKNDPIIKKKGKKEHLTLHQFQNKLENRLNRGKNLSEDEKLLVQNLNQTPHEVKSPEQTDNFEVVLKNKFESSRGGALMTKKQNDLNHLIYPEKITIPKDLRKKGYTYKLNDCYYDYDGRFLYRVPGME